jgi:hypothetical protein
VAPRSAVTCSLVTYESHEHAAELDLSGTRRDDRVLCGERAQLLLVGGFYYA